MKSSLYNEHTFYKAFIADLLNAKREVIIESPYLTITRVKGLQTMFEKVIQKGVKIFVLTKDPSEHDEIMAEQSETCIQYFEQIGVQVLLVQGGHHRKLALIDRHILYEGSLNILSQISSREIMRRITEKETAMEMFAFLHYEKFL